jgi:chromosome partitioning protein
MPEQPARPQRVIAVIAPKGGVGKSTIAAHLLTSARLAGVNAVGVDLDTQRSLVSFARSRVAAGREPGVRVVPGRMTGWRAALAAEAGAALAVVDTPPGVEDDDQLDGLRELARIADLVLVPTPPYPPSAMMVADFAAALARRGGADVWYVLSGVISGRTLLAEARLFLESRGPLCDVELPLRDHVARGIAEGVAVVEDERLGGYEAYRRLWYFVEGRLGLRAAGAAA